MLRPAQPFRLVGAKTLGDDAVGPGKLPERRSIDRTEPRGADSEDSTLALDHHVADVGGRWPHQGDSFGILGLGQMSHPLGAGLGLAEAAAGHQEPPRPVALRRPLRGPCARVLTAITRWQTARTARVVPGVLGSLSRVGALAPRPIERLACACIRLTRPRLHLICGILSRDSSGLQVGDRLYGPAAPRAWSITFHERS